MYFHNFDIKSPARGDSIFIFWVRGQILFTNNVANRLLIVEYFTVYIWQ